jgi:hypothetical protein
MKEWEYLDRNIFTRGKYHTNDITFINLLAENNVVLLIKIDHRRYDCTKKGDRNALLDKLIASRTYLDEQVLVKMNGSQEEKALSGQFDGRNLLHDSRGPLYITHPENPEYIRQTLIKDHKAEGKIFRDITFAIRAHLIDDIFLERVKEAACADRHLAEHIEAYITELEAKDTEVVVSIEDQLVQVRSQIEKALALLKDKILTLDDDSKKQFNANLSGLRQREKELIAEQEQAMQSDLKADYEELSDVLQDVPGMLDTCTMQRKQKLARLITESVMIEEVSVRWLRFTIVWRGPLANTPDVCLIWRQRGRRSGEWTNEEDEYIRSNYPEGAKLTMLEALPIRTWNMIYQRAQTLGVYRKINKSNDIPQNVTMQDLNVIPDRETAIKLATEASKRNNKSYAIWKRRQS